MRQQLRTHALLKVRPGYSLCLYSKKSTPEGPDNGSHGRSIAIELHARPVYLRLRVFQVRGYNRKNWIRPNLSATARVEGGLASGFSWVHHTAERPL